MYNLSELQLRNPIEQLINSRAGDRTFKPRQGGKALRGFCPFHDDGGTPSFDIWPDEWRWRCWGSCGTYGSGIDFVRKWEHLEGAGGFQEACKRLGGESSLSSSEAEKLSQEHDAKRKAQQEAELAEITAIRTRASATRPWSLWNQSMSIDQRAYWNVDRGIPDEWVDKWQLGYTQDLYQSWYHIPDEKITDLPEHRCAYTIPYFTKDQFQTVQFRYVSPNGNGKYHFASQLGTAPFVTLPDMNTGTCVLHEGFAKAAVSQIHIAQGDFQVISYPSEADWQKVIPLMGTYERVVVWGDPGSWIKPIKDPNPNWVSWPLRLAKAIKLAWPNVNLQVVDHGYSDETDKVDDMILNCELTRDKYLGIIDRARPLNRIRVLRH